MDLIDVYKEFSFEFEIKNYSPLTIRGYKKSIFFQLNL